MDTLPRITISTDDFQRLSGLLDVVESVRSESFEQLWRELERAELLEPSEMPPDVVTMNSRVRFSMDGSSEIREMTLCYPKDADESRDAISILAPIGSALLGLKVGQEIDWKLPDGRTKRVRIEGVSYQPEHSGDFSS